MEQHAAETSRMHEADTGSPGSGAANAVDEPGVRALQQSKGRVDVGRLERDVVQPRAGRSDKLRDRALILPGVAGRTMKRPRIVGGIKVLQELELAISGGEERDAQPGHDTRLPGMIDDAIFIGGEAFDGGLDLDVGLLAFDREAHLARERGDCSLVVDAGDAQVVDPFDQWPTAVGKVQWIGKPCSNPRSFRNWQKLADAAAKTGSRITGRHARGRVFGVM